MQIARIAVSLAVLALLALAGLARMPGEHSATLARDARRSSIVFVCQNGVAMSVWSASTFDRLAAERGLAFRATSRAATPSYAQVPLRMKLALALDGYRLDGYVPRVIDTADVRSAERVILIDTELPASASAEGAVIERWSGFPPMREQYLASRAALRTRVEELVARLAASGDVSQ